MTAALGVTKPVWFPQDAPEEPEDLPRGTLAVWAWFPADLVTDPEDALPCAWELYSPAAWQESRLYGGMVEAPVTATAGELTVLAARAVGSEIILEPCTWSLALEHDADGKPVWLTRPAMLVLEAEEVSQ